MPVLVFAGAARLICVFYQGLRGRQALAKMDAASFLWILSSCWSYDPDIVLHDGDYPNTRHHMASHGVPPRSVARSLGIDRSTVELAMALGSWGHVSLSRKGLANSRRATAFASNTLACAAVHVVSNGHGDAVPARFFGLMRKVASACVLVTGVQ